MLPNARASLKTDPTEQEQDVLKLTVIYTIERDEL